TFRADKVLRGFDEDIREAVGSALQQAGVRLYPGVIPTQILKNTEYSVALSNSSIIDVDQILSAVGRTPQTDNLGLEVAGVKRDERKAVRVNDISQTSIPSIYAVGDVTNRVNLTPVAIREGNTFAERLYGGGAEPLSYANIPMAVF